MVATDGRPYRMLELDEFAAAVREGALSWSDAVDALRRWQRFLDPPSNGRAVFGLRLGRTSTSRDQAAGRATRY